MKCVVNLCFVSHLQSMLSLVYLIVLLMVLYTAICTVVFFKYTHDQYHGHDHYHMISTRGETSLEACSNFGTYLPMESYIRHIHTYTQSSVVSPILVKELSVPFSVVLDPIIDSGIVEYTFNLATYLSTRFYENSQEQV